MPTLIKTTIRPTSATLAQWSPALGVGTNSQRVSDDSDLSSVGTVAAGMRDTHQMADLPGSIVVIDHIDISIRASMAMSNPLAPNQIKLLWILGINELFNLVNVSSDEPQTFTSASIARPGGGTWVPADVNALLGSYESTIAAGAFPVDGFRISVYDLWYDVWSPNPLASPDDYVLGSIGLIDAELGSVGLLNSRQGSVRCVDSLVGAIQTLPSVSGSLGLIDHVSGSVKTGRSA